MSSPGYKRVLAHIDTKQYNINSINDFLVKCSGAEAEIIIFTDNRKGLYDSVKREQDKVSINDFLDKKSLELASGPTAWGTIEGPSGHLGALHQLNPS
jgi:hypothetical protein